MTTLNPDKGLKNGSCNVTACQKAGAIYFNKSTRAYYCKDCADQINWIGGRADCMALYGVPLLCELDEPEHPMYLEFETAPYDDLCGCVSVSLPAQMQDQDNHYPPEYLREVVKARLNNPANQRWVEANCPKCNGLGLKPEEEQ